MQVSKHGEPEPIGYHGSDRRAVARGLMVDGHALISWAFLGGCLLLPAAVGVAFVTPGSTIDLWPVALAVWCTVVLGAGVALLLAWRVGGWVRPGQLGTALVALALLVSVLPRFSDLVASVDRLRSVRPLATTIVLLLAVGHMVRSLRYDEIDTEVRPVRELVRLVGFMVLGVLAGVTVLAVSPGLRPVVGWGTSVVCLLGAAAVLVAGRHAAPAVRRGIAAALVLMGIGSFLHHASGADLEQGLAAASMCTGAWVFAGIARDRLRVAFAIQDGRSMQALATLGRYSREVSRERELRHDALNALAAIRSAAEVLAERGQRLDQATRAELSLATRTELARVERMLDPTPSSLPQDVALADVLRPVLLARAHCGLVVEVDVGDTRVLAVPDVVARIVDNLLRNAQRHAPGARVRLLAERRGGLVQLSVTDTGPGIPAPRREAVFAAGETSGPHGQGLGLPSARRLARDQGGDLRLVSSERGCRFVLTLPAPSGPEPVPVPSSASSSSSTSLPLLASLSSSPSSPSSSTTVGATVPPPRVTAG